MAITDSRIKGGQLTLDGQTFGKQQTEMELTPKSEEDGDRVEVVTGDTIEPDETTSWELKLNAIQDFDDPQGFVEFCRQNAGDVVPFILRTSAAGPAYEGTVRVRAVRIGGAVASRLNSETTWPVLTGPTPDYTP